MLVIPKPKLSQEQLDKFLKDPQALFLEALFVLLTLANVFIVYKLVGNFMPFPVTVTWVQLLFGFFFSAILGEAGKEFPKFGFFPRFTFNTATALELLPHTLAYLGMITFANILLALTPSVATYPVLLSVGVFLHHVARFIGCGQIYMPVRWLSIGVMFVGFVIAIADPWTMGPRLFPVALLYGLFSAVFRAWCLEKAMHVVEGKGNSLHNHQVVTGLVLLPVIALLFGEFKFFGHMPYNFTELYTWQTWGCLASVGTLPFVKNIIANRLIRKTGQAPWRALEVMSVIIVFLAGVLIWDKVSIVGWLASLLVISGRTLGMLDVLSKEPEEVRPPPRKVRREPSHEMTPPPHSEEEGLEEGGDLEGEEPPAPADVVESSAPEAAVEPEAVHGSTAPFLGGGWTGKKGRGNRYVEVEMYEPVDH